MVVLARAEFDPQSSDGRPITDLNEALTVITSVLMLLRLYVRGVMIKSLGWDDLLAVFAWGLVVGFSCIEISLVARGVGSHMKDVPQETLSQMFSLFPVDKMVFFMSGGFVRLSVLAYLARINKERTLTICIYGTFASTVAVALTSFFFVLLSCTPVSDVFDADKPDGQCVSNFSIGRMRWAHAILASTLNIIILGLCIWVSLRIAMTRGKIFRPIMALIVGLFVVAATITRLVYLVTNDAYTTDLTYKLVRTALWFPLEVHIGLWCSCLPTYQPLFELNSTRHFDRYNMRKLSRSSGWDPQEDVWHRDYMTTNPKVSICGQPRDSKGKRKASDAESTDGIVMLDNERGIHLTTEFSVHVEDRVDSAQDIVSKTPAWNAF